MRQPQWTKAELLYFARRHREHAERTPSKDQREAALRLAAQCEDEASDGRD